MSKIKHLPKSVSGGEQDVFPAHRHWSNAVQEVLVSQTGDRSNGVIVFGGAENGQFCWIGDVMLDGIKYHHDGRLRANDVLLEVQGHCVAGYTLGDVVHFMSVAGQNNGPVLYKTVVSGSLFCSLSNIISHHQRIAGSRLKLFISVQNRCL